MLEFVTEDGKTICLLGLKARRPLRTDTKHTEEEIRNAFSEDHVAAVVVSIAEQVLQQEGFVDRYRFRTSPYQHEGGPTTLGQKKAVLDRLNDEYGMSESPFNWRNVTTREPRIKVRPELSLECCDHLHTAVLEEIEDIHYDLQCDYGQEFTLGQTILHECGEDGEEPRPVTVWEYVQILESLHAALVDERLMTTLDTARDPHFAFTPFEDYRETGLMW